MVKKENNEQRVLGLLSAGHGFSDVNQSALTALLPYLVYANGYDLAKVSVLVMASNLAGSVAQPVFGWMVDKKNQNWMLWLSIFLACGGIALCGTTSSFFLLCVYAMISGIGVAMFHPQAASMVNRISKLKKEGKNISLFSLGGKLGYTFGPMLITLGITRFGTKGTLVFFIPAVIYGILWRKWIRKFDDSTQERNDLKRLEKVEKKDDWLSFSRLCVAVIGRSIVTNVLSTFLALYLIQIFSFPEDLANTLLSVYYGVGIFGVLMGGILADRIGLMKSIIWSLLAMGIALGLLGVANYLFLALVLLVIISITESLCYSPLVVLGQRYLPNHLGIASGVTLGLAVSIGALFCPVFGMLADRFSLKVIFPYWPLEYLFHF